MLNLDDFAWNATNISTTLASGVFGHSCTVLDDTLVVIGGVQVGTCCWLAQPVGRPPRTIEWIPTCPSGSFTAPF